MIVGSATPTIRRGWPPKIECMIPQIAVEASVSTVLKLPSVYKQKIVESIAKLFTYKESIKWQRRTYP